MRARGRVDGVGHGGRLARCGGPAQHVGRSGHRRRERNERQTRSKVSTQRARQIWTASRSGSSEGGRDNSRRGDGRWSTNASRSAGTRSKKRAILKLEPRNKNCGVAKHDCPKGPGPMPAANHSAAASCWTCSLRAVRSSPDCPSCPSERHSTVRVVIAPALSRSYGPADLKAGG